MIILNVFTRQGSFCHPSHESLLLAGSQKQDFWITIVVQSQATSRISPLSSAAMQGSPKGTTQQSTTISRMWLRVSSPAPLQAHSYAKCEGGTPMFAEITRIETKQTHENYISKCHSYDKSSHWKSQTWWRNQEVRWLLAGCEGLYTKAFITGKGRKKWASLSRIRLHPRLPPGWKNSTPLKLQPEPLCQV